MRDDRFISPEDAAAKIIRRFLRLLARLSQPGRTDVRS